MMNTLLTVLGILAGFAVVLMIILAVMSGGEDC